MLLPAQGRGKVRAVPFDGARVEIADFADGLGHAGDVADGGTDRVVGGFRNGETGIAGHVGEGATGPAGAEAAHAPLDVQEEAFALLFAVVDEVDAGFDLPGDDVAERGEAFGSDSDASTGSPRERRA